MNIVILGTGNAATVLGRKFRKSEHVITQVAGRNAASAASLAEEWDCSFTTNWDVVVKNADVYILAVSDQAIEEVVHQLKLPNRVVAHTAASVSKDILKSITPHYGVFYPLQSLRKDLPQLPDIPVFYDGSDELTLNTLKQLAQSIAPGKIIQAGDEERVKLHVAAVVANNFTNHLYKIAEDYCLKEGLDFRLLLPLIKETANRIEEMAPAKAQTGPAIRQDEETIQKHLALLDSHPGIKKLYQFLTESIATSSSG